MTNKDFDTKMFIYHFALLVTTFTFIYDCLFMFVNYPPENRDMVNMIAGVLNTSCLGTIIGFFYGSSKGSQDKQEQMNNSEK